MTDEPTVHELRLVVTAVDYDEALHFYRDVLGLTSVAPSPPPTDASPFLTRAGPPWS